MEQSFIEYSLGKDASSAVLWVYPVRKPRGKAIIMCPGGGFNQIASDHEGRDFAAWELLSEAISLLLPQLFIPEQTGPTFKYCFIPLSA